MMVMTEAIWFVAYGLQWWVALMLPASRTPVGLEGFLILVAFHKV